MLPKAKLPFQISDLLFTRLQLAAQLVDIVSKALVLRLQLPPESRFLTVVSSVPVCVARPRYPGYQVLPQTARSNFNIFQSFFYIG